jgi:hypothetical protein
MKKILLSFPYNLDNKKNKYEKILNTFEENDYYIHNFEGINNDDFNIEILINILSMIEQEYKGEKKIVIFSNIRQILFSWYRIYSFLVDDFIYFIDDKNLEFLKNETNNKVIKLLSNFESINKENLYSKIYLNINPNNYFSITKFILSTNSINCFENLKNFNFDIKRDNHNKKNKIYEYNGNLYQFTYNNYENEKILLTESRLKSIDNSIFYILKDNLYFLIYFTLYFLQGYNEKNDIFLIKLYRFLKEEISKKALNSIEEDIIINILENNIDFRIKIYFLTLLINLDIKSEYILKYFIKNTINDKEYKEFHYSIIYNTFFWSSYRGLNEYEEIYEDKEYLLKKLKKYYIEKENIKIVKKSYKNKKIKIILYLNQLLSLNHSPTKLALDFVDRFYKQDKNIEFMIISEDSYTLNKNEIISPDYFMAPRSKNFKDKHYNYLENNINIYYPNIELSFEQRIKNIVEKILDYNPDVIYSWVNFSIPLDIVYDYFPIVYRTTGGYPINNYDHYIFSENIFKNRNNYIEKKISNNYSIINRGISFKDEINESNISNVFDLNLLEDSFVLVTVGNRLDSEITPDFTDMIIKFLENKKNTKWLIVGRGNFDYINNIYSKYINNKILFHEYERSLINLFKFCNIYVNPIRKGGGISSTIAMKAGLPIITTKNSNDVSDYYGNDNSINNDLDSYLEELEKLYNDNNYYEEKKQISLDRIHYFENKMSKKEITKIKEIFKKVSGFK